MEESDAFNFAEDNKAFIEISKIEKDFASPGSNIIQPKKHDISNRKPKSHDDRELNDMIRNDKNLFQCDRCSYEARLKTNLIRHITTVHEKILNFECDVCSKSFGQKVNLQQHYKKTHPELNG